MRRRVSGLPSTASATRGARASTLEPSVANSSSGTSTSSTRVPRAAVQAGSAAAAGRRPRGPGASGLISDIRCITSSRPCQCGRSNASTSTPGSSSPQARDARLVGAVAAAGEQRALVEPAAVAAFRPLRVAEPPGDRHTGPLEVLAPWRLPPRGGTPCPGGAGVRPRRRPARGRRCRSRPGCRRPGTRRARPRRRRPLAARRRPRARPRSRRDRARRASRTSASRGDPPRVAPARARAEARRSSTGSRTASVRRSCGGSYFGEPALQEERARPAAPTSSSACP